MLLKEEAQSNYIGGQFADSSTGANIEEMQDNMELELRYQSTAWTEIGFGIKKEKGKMKLKVGKGSHPRLR